MHINILWPVCRGSVNSRIMLPSSLKQEFAPALLSWYDEHKRDLPWRNSRDPYEIWIYTQDDNPKSGKLYKPRRNAMYNYSNYQATVSLPGWSE